ncbi:unnamed protein product [Echinostoma caproni]|uniref:KH domain-containing protein n=1 Tax=Echinostoma caproni TaxID=27848 RepID=A0A183A5T5_9TREM|nr:unnamed protein product [Echinostoma caproni]
MAFTSVVTAYPAQPVTDLSNGTIGLQAFPSFQTVNIPQSKQMSLVNSSEASTSLIVPSVTPPPPPPQQHTPYFQSASLPNAYFTTTNSANDPFRFIHPTLHALINPYTSFRSSPYQIPVTNGQSTRACLLPTPASRVQTPSAETVPLGENSGLGRNTASGEGQCESGTMSEDQLSIKHSTSTSESQFPHQNTIILIVRLLMSGKRGENVKKYREEDFTQGLLRMGDEGLTCPPVTLRLLVPATQCGSIIGKGGSRIKDVRESPAKGPVIPYRPKSAFVNHAMMCPTGPYPAGVMHTPIAYAGIHAENNPEHAYATCTSTHGMVINSPAQINTEPSTPIPSSVGQPMLGTIGISQPKIVTVDGNMNAAFSASTDSPTTAGNALNPGRPNLVGDLLADPSQLTNALSFSDFSNNPVSLLNAIHSNHLATNSLPNPILNPIAPGFAFPELSLNPRLLGFYNPQPIAVPHPNGTDVSDEATDPRQPNGAFLPDLYANNPLLSLIHSNGYLQSTGMLSPVPPSPVPILQNKSSILGLPAFPLQPTLLSSSSGLPACPEDTNVIKEIVLSNDLIGCIIGRGGTTVNEIRNISKAQVKISNCEDGAKDRKVTLSGSPHAVNLAHFLIINSVAAHQQMWSFNVQLASAATLLMTQSRAPSDSTESIKIPWPALNIAPKTDVSEHEWEPEASSNCPNHKRDVSQNAYENLADIPRSVPDIVDSNPANLKQHALHIKMTSCKPSEFKQKGRSKIAPY